MARALVTGASSGIGLACVQLFLENSFEVVAQFRTSPRTLMELKQRLGSALQLVQAELGREERCVELVRQAGHFSVLVHAAGIWFPAPIRQLEARQLEEIFRVNLFSAYYLAREASKVMERGAMVFIGSTAGQRGEPGYSHYAGSKAALWGLVQSLAQELAPDIRVNMVSPGWVHTPMAAPALSDPQRLARIENAIPLKRIAQPEDVACAVLFLASEQQRHITGVDLPISGGALLPLPRG